MGYKTYFSSASIARISYAYVFEDRETGLCRGLLFEYHDGGSRAVGQCRLGFDERKEYRSPSTICFRSVGRGVRVHLGKPPATHEEGWETRTLDAGMLYFWFAEKSSALVIA